MKTRTILLTATALAALTATGAAAQQKGDITLGLGLGYVAPKDDNGSLAGNRLEIGDDTQVTLTLEYFLTDQIGIELLAATPFTHDLTLGGANIGTVKHLPPTISVNYHLDTKTNFTPFAGLGLNYTTALDVDSPVGNVTLDDSWGLAAHLGVDMKVSEHGQLRADVRWIDIDMDAKLDGQPIGTAQVDPWVLGVSYIHTF